MVEDAMREVASAEQVSLEESDCVHADPMPQEIGAEMEKRSAGRRFALYLKSGDARNRDKCFEIDFGRTRGGFDARNGAFDRESDGLNLARKMKICPSVPGDRSCLSE